MAINASEKREADVFRAVSEIAAKAGYGDLVIEMAEFDQAITTKRAGKSLEYRREEHEAMQEGGIANFIFRDGKYASNETKQEIKDRLVEGAEKNVTETGRLNDFQEMAVKADAEMNK